MLAVRTTSGVLRRGGRTAGQRSRLQSEGTQQVLALRAIDHSPFREIVGSRRNIGYHVTDVYNVRNAQIAKRPCVAVEQAAGT
jgi:hypothetical protein